MTSLRLEQQIEALRVSLAQSRASFAEGRRIDLAGLDVVVRQITESAKAAPPGEKPAILAALRAFGQELDGLAAALRRQHDAAALIRAAGAYGAECGLLSRAQGSANDD